MTFVNALVVRLRRPTGAFISPRFSKLVNNDERAALHESLAISLDQMKKGQLIDGDEVLARLRARR